MNGASLALFSVLALAPSALATTSPTAAVPQTVTWTGAANSDWFNAGNWDVLVAPDADDHAIIANTGITPNLTVSSITIGQLTIHSGATLHLSNADLTVAGRVDLDGALTSASSADGLICSGDLDISATGSYLAGGELIDVNGAGTMTISASSTPSPRVRVIGGARACGGATVSEFFLSGGTFEISDNGTLTVNGNAQLQAGTLNFAATGSSFDTIDVNGDWLLAATTLGATTSQSRIFVSGDWIANGPFSMANGFVYLDGGDADIGGTQPEFHRVQFTSGVKSLLSDVSITGHLKTTSGTTAGSGWLLANGTVTPHSSPTQVLNRLRVSSGANQITSLRVNDLQVVGGSLQIGDNSTLTVNNDAQLSGGSLNFATSGGSFDTLDIKGNLIQTGSTLGVTSTQSRIYVEGDWSADTAFVMDLGWVFLKGANTAVGGASPAFKRLSLAEGDISIQSQTEITGTVVSTGGVTTGPEWLQMTANTQNISTGANQLGRVRIAADVVPFAVTKIGELEITGGELHVLDNTTLTVTGDAYLIGGSIAYATAGASFETLLVEGNVVHTGTTSGTTSTQSRFRVRGNYSGTNAYSMPLGWFYLDGASPSTVGGASPTFGNLDVSVSTRTLTSDVDVLGSYVGSSAGVLDVASRSMDIALNVTVTAAGAEIVGTGPVLLSGTGTITTNTLGTCPIEVSGGLRTAFVSTVDALAVTGGELRLGDNGTMNVIGDATFTAGVLSFALSGASFDTLNIDGNLTQTGATIGDTTTQSRIYVAGNWSADGAFSLAEGWVHLDGGNASIGGLLPGFKRLSLVSGAKTVNSQVLITGTIKSTGGTTDGPEWLHVTDNVQPIQSAANSLGRLRIAAGVIPMLTSKVGNLEITGGELVVTDNASITATGDATLFGGLLSFALAGASFDNLIVEGNVVHTGMTSGTTTPQSRFYVRGNWSSTGAYSMPEGWVLLDGTSGSTVGGTSPTFGNLQVSGNTRSLVSDVDVLGSLTVSTNGVLDVASSTLDIAEDLTSTSAGAQVIGAGPVLLSGTGTIFTNVAGTPPVEVTGGLRTSAVCTVAGVTVSGGELRIGDNGTMNVNGDANFPGGILSFAPSGGSFDTLHVNGNLVQTAGTIGTTSTQSRIYLDGDWTANSPFVLDSGWVFLDGGDAAIGGIAPAFKRLRLDSGVKTVNSQTVITGTVLSFGGTTDGPEWLHLIDNTQSISTGANQLGRVRVAAGVSPIATSNFGEFEITGGEAIVNDNATVTVTGNAKLLAGTLSFAPSGGSFDRLNVQGSVFHTATVSGTSSTQARFTCEGDWSSNGTFAMTSGQVELSGAGATTLSGSIPGNDPTFPTLLIKNGERRVLADTFLSATAVNVNSASTLTVAGGSLMPLGTPVNITGTLDVEPGASFAPDATSPLTINTGGRLELIGTAPNPAVLGADGSAFVCTVNGQLAARFFEVRSPNTTGLTMGSSSLLGTAPEDFRDGLFTNPDPAVNSALLNLEGLNGAFLVNLRFEDPLGQGTYNVRRNSATTSTLANAFGGFGGEVFESDLQGTLDWTALTTSEVSVFNMTGGPERSFAKWITTNEAAGLSVWRLESSLSAAGPFSLVTELAATGPGTYNFEHVPLTANVKVFYRLLEVHGGGFIDVTAEDSATPWSAAQPANVATVGATGDFATIQEAINAATSIVSIISVEAGSYPSFQVLGMPIAQLHIISDGSGPITVDASSAPVEIAFTNPGQEVQLVGIDITGGVSNGAVLVHDNAGLVVLDEVDVAGGTGQAGLYAVNSAAVSVSRCNLTGTPGIDIGPTTEVYIGRGSVDQLDAAAGAQAQLAGVTPGATNITPGAQVAQFSGVMPDLQFGSFQSLGVPFTLDIEAEPGSFYQLAIASNPLPLDIGDTGAWQMLLMLNINTYKVINQGVVDGVTGQRQLTLALPADGVFLGFAIPVQTWSIAVVPNFSVRFSNMRTVVAMP